MTPDEHRKIRRGEGIGDTERFYIVMSLDKPGPRERENGGYHRHASEADARHQARKLSMACGGGRFAVLGATYVTGWIEIELTEAEIPF